MESRLSIVTVFLLLNLIINCEGNNESAEYWIHNAYSSHLIGDDNLAVMLYDKALKLDPNNTDAWRNRGLSYQSLGNNLKYNKPWDASLNYENALQSYDKAIQIDPYDARNWYFKAEFLFLQERYKGALECYNKVLSISPNSPDAQAKKSEAIYHLEEIDDLWYASKLVMVAIFLILLLIFLAYSLWMFKFNIPKSKNLNFEKFFLDKSPEEISDRIENIIESFQVTKNRLLKLLFYAFPWLGLILAAKSWFNYANPMEASTFLAVSLSIFAFLHLSRLIPKTLSDLWKNRVIGANEPQKKEKDQESELIDSTGMSIISKEKMDAAKFLSFINDFEKILNSPCQWISAIIFAIIGLWIYNYNFGASILNLDVLSNAILLNLHYPFEPILNSFIGFIIGCMAWRMIAVGIQVFSMGWMLDIQPNLLDQDKCGGLSSLGYLSFWNVLIVSILGIFLAGWIILAKIPSYPFTFGEHYVPIHTSLLVIVVEWLLFGFLMPLWGIHKELLANRERFLRDRGKLSSAIENLRREMLERISSLSTEEYSEMSSRLDRMIKTYNINPIYPLWPFNTDILKKLAISQMIPVLTLLGIGDAISGIIKPIVDALS